MGSTYWANPIPPELSDNDRVDPDTLSHEPSTFPKWPPRQDDGLEWAGLKFRPPRSSGFSSTKTPRNNQCKSCGKRYNLTCVLALLPSQDVCEKLCDLFFASVFPLTPLLHVRGFAQDFRDFWAGVTPGHLHESEPSLFLRKKPGYLCLLSAILFAALASSSDSRVRTLLGETEIPQASDMYFMAMVSATLSGFPRRPSMYSLAAYIFTQSQFAREEEFSDAPDFISTSFRIALGMGLHRHLPEAGFTVAERETRRRLWWYILHLDVMSSASSGLSPLFIDEKMANADTICQYDHVEGDPDANRQVDIRYLVASQRYQVTKEIRTVLIGHFEDSFQSLRHVSEMERRLRTVAENTSATTEMLLRSRPSSVSGYSNVASPRNPSTIPGVFDRVWKLQPDAGDHEVINFTTWSVPLLHLMVHKAYCVLYHPLFRDPVMSAHESIRSNAVKHAQSFIQLFLRVCNDATSEPFHWMYPGTYQPLQAVSLLLADLLQHPHSDDAALSRGLIDAIFELYQVDEGIVSQNDPHQRQLSPAGKDAWNMLVRTRRKALEQIGVDHHVLYPSSVVSLPFCICGERIAQDDPEEPGSRRLWTRVSPPAHTYDTNLEPAGLSPGSLGQIDFDWSAWDNALGPSVGPMP
ncbi:hypothetical protein A1O3_07177 [Capronia epimyces CBS 606.96]|uniref:Xylanolytic transcriptional activator regulatory domain-containing protein n=1 Tax=Capronia epimyces CBS 606.96 TaxID=1182542 RepID=W9YF24_9EURO|nr:uncharacterized protein A1O3_07177 [Capronia epimyces CBS 606.96]EXJ80889.1 hypothetical protein A1O3_07177 [Capronia epimyces CBS 606.96]